MISNGMKILIGTPIHEIKDYAMERWLANVAKLQLEHPADLLLMDNSPGLDYVEKVKGYCAKYGIKDYKIEHLELSLEQGADERIGRSRETIRQYLLAHDYDAWFTWECDQIIPTNALDELIELMKTEDYMIVNPNNWSREIPPQPNTDFGFSLIKRECLEKYGFLPEFGTNPDLPESWVAGEFRFRKQVLDGGGNYVEVYGIINPVYHLRENE